MTQIKRALISCTDKTGLTTLSQFLSQKGIEILSTGGTAKLLREQKIKVIDVSDYTGSPEILDGRLKTLHPKIHGGILAIRANETHQNQIKENSIKPIDLIIVNLYEFEKTIAQPDCDLAHAIENIDIGGPTMLRAAAKNYKDVLVVVDPADYPRLMDQIEGGVISEEFKFSLAVKVFQKTAHYDTAISQYLTAKLNETTNTEQTSSEFNEDFQLQLKKIQDLRYGENPHQKAAFYKDVDTAHGIVDAEQIQGKELSFNNILDVDAAFNCCREFKEPTCVIVKHLNPCGVSIGHDLSDAFLRARAGDPVSCFGGIVACNQTVDKSLALHIAETFFEAVIAPSYDSDALEIFQKKKNLRVIRLKDFAAHHQSLDVRRVSGGYLLQDADNAMIDIKEAKVVTRRQPTENELKNLDFAWKVVKHVKSNAIVFAKDRQCLGIGAGQMSRVDSVKIAGFKAQESFKDEKILNNAVMASDAFFPFRDGIDAAAAKGIKAIVQPGGSIRDNEVIEACDENGITMIFTGMRHFRH